MGLGLSLGGGRPALLFILPLTPGATRQLLGTEGNSAVLY